MRRLVSAPRSLSEALLGDESARNWLQVDLTTQKMLDEMLENEKESVAYGEIVNEP